MLVTAFRSPATAAAFTASIPESTFLACYFASAPLDSAARSVFGSATDPQFAPRPAASTPQTRYSFLDQLDLPHPRPPLPLRTVTSLRIKAFCRTCRSSTRLPISPDLRSLPAAVSIASYDCGSTFPVRYVLGGLLFLKSEGQAVLGRQSAYATPWLTDRHGYDPTWPDLPQFNPPSDFARSPFAPRCRLYC